MNFKKDEGIVTPTRGHSDDAGLDIYSPKDIIIYPNEISERIDLGFGVEIPKNYYGEIVERSSQGKKGILSLGRIVDSGYTGNIHVTLANLGNEIYYIIKGDRICQLIIKPCLTVDLLEVKSFNETERGDGAHGSTGK